MTNRRLLAEWPLAAFTLALQVASGIALATTIASTQPAADLRILRFLGGAVFPVIALGSLISLLHLGRPFAAWRALSNSIHSRLSLEVLLTSFFTLAAFFYSLAWWFGTTVPPFHVGEITSLLGIAAVVASAAIYCIPSRRLWNSPWVITSFIGSTITVAGLTLSACCTRSPLAATLVTVGSAMLLLSGIWMWLRASHPLEVAGRLRIWFAAYLLLVAAPPMLVLSANSLSTAALACCTATLGMITGRLLMFAMAELEERF